MPPRNTAGLEEAPASPLADMPEWEPPRLYSWDVMTPVGNHRACGVADDRDRAVEALGTALREELRGSYGVVQRVELAMMPMSTYEYAEEVAFGWIDASGALNWAE